MKRRDFVLLPLACALTVIAMLAGGEVFARMVWPVRHAVSCEVQTAAGKRFKPNCIAWNKTIDGPWIENRFNDCGYRTAESCRVVPGQLRVVVFGTSISWGYGVPYDQTFAARASKTLSARCGARVDFQNLATEADDVPTSDRRVPEALRLKPNAVLLLINSYDLQSIDASPDAPVPAHGFNMATVKAIIENSNLLKRGQHYLYRDPAMQISVFLKSGVDDTNGYTATPLPAKWEARVKALDALLVRMRARTEAAGIPLILAYEPRRVQVLLDIPRFRRPNVDPLGLDRRLREIAAADGVRFVDLTPPFAASRNYNDLFYTSDGHPTSEGDVVVADAIVSELLAQPTFAQCDRNTTAALATKTPA